MKILLNNEKEIQIGSFNENVDEFGINFNGIYLVAVGETTQFPSIDGLDNFSFTTIKVINDNNIEIPLQGNYNKISSINISYDDESNNYLISYHIN